MNDFVFEREFSPWDMALSKLKAGDTLSAGRFIALMEQDQTVEPEMAAMELEQKGVMLDVTELPRLAASGKTDARLALESRLYREQGFLTNLEENDPLRLSILQLKSIPAIENEELLAQKAALGDEKAMEQLTSGSLRLVYDIAGAYLDRGVLLMDLMQEGSLGLWQAVLNYREGTFRETAVWWIRQAMARVVTLQAHANGVGSHMARAMERYRTADRELLTQLGRNPSEEEIALEMGVTAEEAAAVGKMLREVETMDRVRKAAAPKESDPEDEQAVEDTAYFQSRQRINELLSGLSGEDAKLLTMRFGLEGKAPMTAQQVGAALGMTAEEVTSREAAALASLRKDG